MSLAPEFQIGDKRVANGAPPFVIAEAGSNFNQSLDTAYRLIDAAADAGADAVKFQLFRAETLYPKGTEGYRTFKAVQLNPDWVEGLDRHAREHGIPFLASAFDAPSVDVLESIEVRAHKIASSEATNRPLLAYMATKGRPILLSTGMCDMVDVHEAVDLCVASGNDRIALLQCGTVYPLPPRAANLKVMDLFRETFGGPVGFSDHTLGIAAAVAAVARGAAVIEKHFTLDRTAKGPDHAYALEPADLKRLIAEVREAHAALGAPVKEMLPEERQLGRRDGLYAARDIGEGETISAEDIQVKRPALGLRDRYRDAASGARARRSIAAGAPITWEDIAW
ncbi:MAG: N-acetylneuraminate synthase family protein [Kiloniellales bacterium]